MVTDKTIKTPLARAKGWGSAHEGVHHWMAQRVSALALVPLVFWLVYSLLSLREAGYGAFVLWLSTPWNTTLLSLCIITLCSHAVLGLQVVAEDYVSSPLFRFALIIAIRFFFFALAVLSLFSILMIAI